METQAHGDPGARPGAGSSERSAFGRLMAHVAPVLGGKITGGVLVGALIALTGFGPEHWFAVAFEKLQLTQAVATAQKYGVDLRVVLVAAGVAIVAFDIIRRNQRDGVAAKVVFASEAAAAGHSPAASVSVAENKPDAPPLSLIVLPFQNLSDEPGQDYFVDGLTDDITSEMSRLSGSFVIARNTAFTYKGEAVNVKQVTRELNVRYALEGSVRRSGDDLRVSAKLVEGETGKTIWADKFDRQVAQIFQLQDGITSELASALNIELITAEGRRSAGASQPKATDLIMQAKAAWFEGGSLENYQRSIAFYQRALAIDPDNVEALGGKALAYTVMFNGSLGAWISKEEMIAHSEPAALQALSIAPANVIARVALGSVQRVKGQWETAVQTCAEAIRRDPNCLSAYHGMSNALLYLGRYDQAAAGFERMLVLSPRDPYAFWANFMLGVTEFARGNYEGCVMRELAALQINPSSFEPYATLAHAYRRLGRHADFERAIGTYRAMPHSMKSISEFKSRMLAIAGGVTAITPVFEEAMREEGFPE